PPAAPPLPKAAPAAPIQVAGIRVGVHPGFTRIVLDVDAPVHLERLPQGAPRSVGVDLPNTVWQAARQGRLVAKALSYRVERTARGANRLILDAEAPIQMKSMSMLPPDGERRYRVVLDVTHAGPSPKR
ncbi:MAG: hypothetical protein K2X91_08740, partial [Thermoleophilia bacterium]|nr:hypothetical protein [Thermoleophilia bacterium]